VVPLWCSWAGARRSVLYRTDAPARAEWGVYSSSGPYGLSFVWQPQSRYGAALEVPSFLRWLATLGTTTSPHRTQVSPAFTIVKPSLVEIGLRDRATEAVAVARVRRRLDARVT
jgi:hypothetical protein